MDVNRLINMVTRMVMRTVVDTSIDYAARKGKPDADLTPEERKQARVAKKMATKAKKAVRLGQRFFR